MAHCLSDAEIADFLSDSLSREEDRRIVEHAELCDSCRERLDLAGEDCELRRMHAVLASPPVACSQTFLDEMAAGGISRWAGANTSDFELAAGYCAAAPEEPTASAESASLPESIGQYAIVSQIGRGGMGVVYEAIHPRLKRRVALKVIAAHHLADEESLLRFHREMESIGRLQHPNIIQAFDAGEDEGVHFLVMELVVGSDVESIARAIDKFPVADACEIIRQAALGLHHAHAHGLIHRDIKPSNLLVSREGAVKIVDLGLARLLESDSADRGITQTGVILGTANYMSPEQGLGGGRDLDARTDLYSLGCVLYRLLAGRIPFPECTTPHQQLVAHAQHEPSPLRALRSDVSLELAAIVARLTAKRPDDRFATAAEVAESLAAFAESASLPALLQTAPAPAATQSTDTMRGSTFTSGREPAAAERPRRRRIRRWIAALVVVAAVAGVASVVAVAWTPLFRERREVAPDPARDHERVAAFVVGKVEPTATTGGEAAADAIPADLVVEQRPPGPRHFDDLEPLHWQNVLDQPPFPIFWGRGEGLSTWQYSSALEQVAANTNDYGLLALGTTDARRYKLRVDIHQARWTPGAGVFFGCRESQDEQGRRTFWSQFLRVRRFLDNDDMPHFGLERGAVTCSTRADGRIGFHDLSLATERISEPSGEISLEIVVENGWLKSVKLDGTPLERLIEARTNQQFEPKDYDGAFGLFSRANACVYRNGRFMVLGPR